MGAGTNDALQGGAGRHAGRLSRRPVAAV